MNNVKQLYDLLKIIENEDDYCEEYVPESIKETDIKLNKLIENYSILSIEEKNIVRNSLSIKNAWILLCFSINMATYALRLSKERYFINGLTALAMIIGILDIREIILVMPLFYDVSKKNNFSFTKILAQQDSFSDFVKLFLNRREEDKSLECMGYILTRDKNNNLFYKRTW